MQKKRKYLRSPKKLCNTFFAIDLISLQVLWNSKVIVFIHQSKKYVLFIEVSMSNRPNFIIPQMRMRQESMNSLQSVWQTSSNSIRWWCESSLQLFTTAMNNCRGNWKVWNRIMLRKPIADIGEKTRLDSWTGRPWGIFSWSLGVIFGKSNWTSK